jgi:peptidoglycan/xylan/chitin deacetylase (PgdA/CDA1 family)
MRVAFLVGSDTPSTLRSVEAACNLPNIRPVGILLDTGVTPRSARIANLRRNVKREGIGYLYRRIVGALRDWVDARAARLVPKPEIDDLLRRAFPEANLNLEEVAAGFKISLIRAGNLNRPAAVESLRRLDAELGIVIGTRILKPAIFSVPRLGCINLHKGAVPDYRGMPPGFWEIYDGAQTAGVTVHFVDEGLDTGDVVGAAEIPIHPLETPDSLRTKLDIEGARLLAETVSSIADGTCVRHPQPPSTTRPRRKPTHAQRLELAKRAPRLRAIESDEKRIFKTAFYLFLYRAGIFYLAHRFRNRGVIILYHRVNDFAGDNLTVTTRALAEQILILNRYYRPVSTTDLVAIVRNRQPVPPGSVCIHFDDCYRDVLLNGSRLLRAAGVPATMFIATGFIDTDRVFEHDRAKYPYRFENLHRADIPALIERGFEIGAHTVNHADLGRIDPEAVRFEVTESRRTLEEITGREVPLFSFPFGRKANIREDSRRIIEDAGFHALFSAHGGFVSAESDPYDIPRIGINSRYRALDLIMELEGLSLPQLFPKLKSVFRSSPAASTTHT